MTTVARPLEKVTIRKASQGDQKIIQALRASVGWSVAETGLAAMAEGRSVVYIVELDGQPLASGVLVLQSDDRDLADGRRHALISNLIVDARHQGHGLGTRLLEFLEAEACRRGFDTVTIGVDQTNVRARNLYQRHGYASLKDKNEAWGPVNYLVKKLRVRAA